MKTILILLSVLVFAAKFSCTTPAKVFSCEQGCKDDSECPNNSHCVAVNQNSECGLCLCKAGFRTSGSNCVANKNINGGASEITTEASVTLPPPTEGAPTTRAPISTTQGGPTTQGPPPSPASINCADFACGPTFPSKSDSDNPFVVRASLFNESDHNCKSKLSNPGRSCKMQGGGGVCYGVYCLTVEPGNEYCICEHDRVDRQCAVEKPGKCDSATSQLVPGGYRAQNKRFRNKSSPDNGSVYARHFAASFDDCVKLCTWTGGSCRSVNFGTLAGQQVCELLSTTVTKGSLLEPWLVDAQGWQYAQVTPNTL